MVDPLQVTATVRIPGEAIRFKAVRAGGAGGQNVNKVSSKVELRIDLNRLDAEGLWMIVSDRTRDQLKNLDDAREKAAEAIRAALVRPIPRKATRPTRASKERRLTAKKRDSDRKQNRRGDMD